MSEDKRIPMVVTEAEVDHDQAKKMLEEITNISYSANTQQLHQIKEDLRITIKNFNDSLPKAEVCCSGR